MKEPIKYLTKIYWSEEDGCYVGEVPALKGCLSHGSTYQQTARHLQEAIELWLESAHRHQDPIPEPEVAAEELRWLLPLLNVSKLAKISKINKHTLASKLRRKSAFTRSEAKRIQSAIRSC